MASILGHLSIAALYWIFPGVFSLGGLLVGSLLPDIDSLSAVVDGARRFGFPRTLNLKVWKEFALKTWHMETSRPLHNLLGLIILLPLGLIVVPPLEAFLGLGATSSEVILLSLLIGGASHLLLDIPAHRRIRYLSMFERQKSSPLVLFKNMTLFQRLYPFENMEDEHEYMERFTLPHFNYLLLSNLLFLLAGVAVFITVAF